MEHTRYYYYGLAVLDALDREEPGHGRCPRARAILLERTHVLMGSAFGGHMQRCQEAVDECFGPGTAGRLFQLVATLHQIGEAHMRRQEDARLQQVVEELCGTDRSNYPH